MKHEPIVVFKETLEGLLREVNRKAERLAKANPRSSAAAPVSSPGQRRQEREAILVKALDGFAVGNLSAADVSKLTAIKLQLDAAER